MSLTNELRVLYHCCYGGMKKISSTHVSPFLTKQSCNIGILKGCEKLPTLECFWLKSNIIKQTITSTFKYEIELFIRMARKTSMRMLFCQML